MYKSYFFFCYVFNLKLFLTLILFYKFILIFRANMILIKKIIIKYQINICSNKIANEAPCISLSNLEPWTWVL